MDKCSGNGDALHLTAGELVWHPVREFVNLHLLEGCYGGFTDARLSCEQQGELDILCYGERGKKLERLENEADVLATDTRQAGIVERSGGGILDPDLAGGREIHCSREVQQRRFAAAATTDEGNELAARYL
jgi:hypothetical protein